jgi:CBS domain-containing protein
MTLAGSTPAGYAPHDGRLSREVREAMTPGVISVPGDASLKQVYGALTAHRVHAVLVVDRKSANPLGWINAAGLLRWMVEASSDQHTAAQAVCEPVHTISPSATVRDAVAILLKPGVSHVLVTHYGALSGEGVLSNLDVVALMSGR